MNDFEVCPKCGSNKVKHTFPKDKTIPVYLARCLRCNYKKGWRQKSDYKKHRDMAEEFQRKYWEDKAIESKGI